MEEFFPATFRMDVREEREAFFIQQKGKKGHTFSIMPLVTQIYGPKSSTIQYSFQLHSSS